MSSLIRLPRPRVERERGWEGLDRSIRGSHGWLCGDRDRKPLPNWTSWPPSNAGCVCATGGWPMTASLPLSASVIAFPARTNHAGPMRGSAMIGFARLASDPDAFSERFGHRLDRFACT